MNRHQVAPRGRAAFGTMAPTQYMWYETVLGPCTGQSGGIVTEYRPDPDGDSTKGNAIVDALPVWLFVVWIVTTPRPCRQPCTVIGAGAKGLISGTPPS